MKRIRPAACAACILLLLFALCACGAPAAPEQEGAAHRYCTADELKAAMDSGEALLLLDVQPLEDAPQ